MISDWVGSVQVLLARKTWRKRRRSPPPQEGRLILPIPGKRRQGRPPPSLGSPSSIPALAPSGLLLHGQNFKRMGSGTTPKNPPLPFEAAVRLRLGEEFSVLVAAPQQPCTPKNNPASPPTSRGLVSSVGAALEMQSSCTPSPRTPPSTSSGSSEGSALGSHSPSVPPLQLEEQLP